MDTTCACGCGQVPRPGKRYLKGHWSRTPDAKANYERHRTYTPINPNGLCECGCGQTTPRATVSRGERGYYAGQHLRFVRGHQTRLLRAEDNGRWRGGRWTHKSGYVYIYVPDHPHKNRDQYVLEHRLVAERTIGRHLLSNEHVHHINGIRDDNRPENLVVLTKTEHHRLHGPSTLEAYRKQHPEQAREAGRKGAEARWGKKSS